MFNIFKKKNELVITARINGQLRDIKQVEDAMFAQELIGKWVAIEPYTRTVVSPDNVTIIMVCPTHHALGIQLENGLELLIYSGIDTVKLKGERFKSLVHEGQSVKVGEPIVEVDLDLVREKGYKTNTLMVVTSPKTKQFH